MARVDSGAPVEDRVPAEVLCGPDACLMVVEEDHLVRFDPQPFAGQVVDRWIRLGHPHLVRRASSRVDYRSVRRTLGLGRSRSGGPAALDDEAQCTTQCVHRLLPCRPLVLAGGSLFFIALEHRCVS